MFSLVSNFAYVSIIYYFCLAKFEVVMFSRATWPRIMWRLLASKSANLLMLQTLSLMCYPSCMSLSLSCFYCIFF